MRTFSRAFGAKERNQRPRSSVQLKDGTEGGRKGEKNGKKARAIRRHHLQENRKCVALSLDNDGGGKKAHRDKCDVEFCPKH